MMSVICGIMIACLFWRESHFNSVISDASRKYGLDRFLVKAIVKRESNFRPQARGSKGEIGLMQVTPAVNKEYAHAHGRAKFTPEELCHPAINTDVGCWYLAKAMKRYRGFPDPVPFALAHYNAGAANVDRWMRMTGRKTDAREFFYAITYPTTQRYVRYVTRRRWWYRLFRV